MGNFLASSAWLLPGSEVTVPPIGYYPHPFDHTSIIPSTVSTDPSIANFISTSSGLDGPMLSSINSTAFDWWYFDCISNDLQTSLSIVFYTSLSSAFPFLSHSDRTTVLGVYSTFPNGTKTSFNLNASEAIITTIQDGSSGYYSGIDASWVGSPDLSSYLVSINSPENGLVGNITLESTAPAHYPCGPLESGVNMEVAPNIGWSNAMPDANGVVDFSIHGSQLQFNGIAYHDKNWGDQPFQDNVASWFWGHARLGNYSIVWFDALDLNGTEHVSAYVSQNNTILTASCTPHSIEVRPTGAKSQYPPHVASGNPDGYNIVIDLNAEGLGRLELNITIISILAEAPRLYIRGSGSVVGKFVDSNDGVLLEGGVAVFDQFTLVDKNGLSIFGQGKKKKVV